MLELVLEYRLDWVAFAAIVVNAMVAACAYLHSRPTRARMPRFAWMLVVLILVAAAWGAQLATNPRESALAIAAARADALGAFGALAFIVIGFTTVLSSPSDEQAVATTSESGLAQNLIDFAPDCVQVVTTEGVIQHVNAAGLAVFEAASPNELVGEAIILHVVDQQQESFAGMFQSVCNGHAASLQLDVRTCKGNGRRLDVCAIPMRDSSGKVNGVLVMARDLTALIQAQAERDRLQSELLTLADDLSSIVTGAHDTAIQELSNLSRNIEQIKQSVTSQRSLASRASELQEVT